MRNDQTSVSTLEEFRQTRPGGSTEEGAALAASLVAGPHAAPVRKSVIVIGGGQAGLSVGYHLQRQGVEDFVILDAAPRIGDVWRRRWDSLHLFTPAMYDGLHGMRFPGPKGAFPTKDQMADYLEAYASRFNLPVLSAARVDSLTRKGERYIVKAGNRIFESDRVVVAMSNYQVPRLPAFAGALDAGIRQIQAKDYRNPDQLAAGDVLIVGAGNSGAEIARDLGASDLGASHRVVMAGPGTGEIPGKFNDFLNRHVIVHLLNRLVFPHIMSVKTPIGRRVRPKVMKRSVPLIRVKSADLARLGVKRVGRVIGAKQGLPLLDDGTTLAVANIIWCTGFEPGFSWIKLPVLLDDGEPDHQSGVVSSAPGLYFVGLHFLTAMSSAMVNGVGRDARRIAALIARQAHDKPLEWH